MNYKYIIALTIIIVNFLFIPLKGLSKNTLKDSSSLLIYIKNKEYNGKTFLNEEDNMLYTSLDDLAKSMKFTWEIVSEDEKDTIYISSNNEEKLQYDYSFIKKDDDIFVPLTTFAQSTGYSIAYNKELNVLDIFNEAIIFNEEEQVNPDNDVKTGSFADLTLTAGDEKFDGAIVIIRSMDERYFNFVSTIAFFNPIRILLTPGKYKITIKDKKLEKTLQEETVEAIEGFKIDLNLK